MLGWEEVQNVERALESGQREEEEQKETTEPWWYGFCLFPDRVHLWGLEFLEQSDLVLTLESDNVSMRSLLPWAGAIDLWLEQGRPEACWAGEGKEDFIQLEVGTLGFRCCVWCPGSKKICRPGAPQSRTGILQKHWIHLQQAFTGFFHCNKDLPPPPPNSGNFCSQLAACLCTVHASCSKTWPLVFFLLFWIFHSSFVLLWFIF